MSFSNLKKQSNLGALTSKLVKEVEKMSQTSGGDDRLWKPEVDKSGNGYAVIRFLPAPEGEELPWAKMYTHAFQGPGGWLIDNCLTTLGDKCPVCEHNGRLWNSGSDSDKETARKQKRKLSYYANIYVVRDSANPDNEGKVFLYKFGKKIFDKLTEAMQPEFDDEEPINPFDFWQGANFKLKIKKVAGYWNYDSSEFDRPSELLDGDDDALEALWKKEYSLSDIVKRDEFKDYDGMKKRLDYVLGNVSSSRSQDPEVVDEEAEFEAERTGRSFTPSFTGREEDAIASAKPASDEEDDTLSYFQALADS